MNQKFNDFLYYHHWANVIYYTLKGYYHFKKCPICGHLYIPEEDVCFKCGYEPLYHGTSGELFDELKAEWDNK